MRGHRRSTSWTTGADLNEIDTINLGPFALSSSTPLQVKALTSSYPNESEKLDVLFPVKPIPKPLTINFNSPNVSKLHTKDSSAHENISHPTQSSYVSGRNIPTKQMVIEDLKSSVSTRQRSHTNDGRALPPTLEQKLKFPPKQAPIRCKPSDITSICSPRSELDTKQVIYSSEMNRNPITQPKKYPQPERKQAPMKNSNDNIVLPQMGGGKLNPVSPKVIRKPTQLQKPKELPLNIPSQPHKLTKSNSNNDGRKLPPPGDTKPSQYHTKVNTQRRPTINDGRPLPRGGGGTTGNYGTQKTSSSPSITRQHSNPNDRRMLPQGGNSSNAPVTQRKPVPNITSNPSQAVKIQQKPKVITPTQPIFVDKRNKAKINLIDDKTTTQSSTEGRTIIQLNSDTSMPIVKRKNRVAYETVVVSDDLVDTMQELAQHQPQTPPPDRPTNSRGGGGVRGGMVRGNTNTRGRGGNRGTRGRGGISNGNISQKG